MDNAIFPQKNYRAGVMRALRETSSFWIQSASGYLSGVWNGCDPKPGVRILSYHGVVEQKKDPRLERNLTLLAHFRAHLRFLRRLHVLSLAELRDELGKPSERKKTAVALTFDDGFANNLIAAEILHRYRLPWMLSVPTGVIGEGKALWTVELSLLLLQGRARHVEALGSSWPLGDRKLREAAFQAIRCRMKKLPADLRIQTLERLREQFPAGETQRLLDQFPSLRMLNWREVSELAGAGAEIGSHGVNHEIHHHDQPENLRKNELSCSKAEIERRLGRACVFFSFPNGDFLERSPEEVSAAGYDLAFTTQPGSTRSCSSRYLLPRLDPPGSLPSFVRLMWWELQRG